MKNNNLKFLITNKPLNIKELIDIFYSKLYDSTGTILIHHGKAKYPGKYIKNYKHITINLLIEENEVKENLLTIINKYNINKIHIAHRIGIIYKNEAILFIAAEAIERNSGFDCVREILEYMKQDNIFLLKEMG